MQPASTKNWIESNSNCTPLGSAFTSPPDADMTYEVMARLTPSSSGPRVITAQ
ncbi:hypothetical protein D3C72_2141660 [compost metagenome]